MFYVIIIGIIIFILKIEWGIIYILNVYFMSEGVFLGFNDSIESEFRRE